MGPFDRGILLLYTTTLTLLFMALGVFLAGWPDPAKRLWGEINTSSNYEILWTLVVVYVIMGLRLLWKSLKPERRKQAVVHEGGLGQVRVSLAAVETLAEKAVADVPGIKEVKAKVESSPRGIAMHLKLITAPDINIPAVSEDIQKKVKDSIYNVVGVTVSEVRVAVESFKTAKPRVE
ncbi:alkaline shock response membrane anchor protein AmaP [Desulfallas thermosapovorans]|uniref:Putative alkaline shock family protein YloU n=1 Tax=Desulfallas thermosapovorans DSM 6562 TaxID=1121431 RepID=A0A5S4ZSA5_9FIRM|nr:alkaline shock response membrane anchor protein AmaP [Desulfallas thermosapovorans]TYO95629.1 putative alkaline shock family protein YloU [Desulfallas thermosapovorans DSM 6562]